MGFPLLYEINTRCWLASLSEDAGRRVTLADVPDSEFNYWQQCGFTHLWLMGVWKLGGRGRAWSRKCYSGREEEFRCSDVAGSPYATCGYRASPTLGGEAALATFRRKLNDRGIRLLLDFIPNHTALDHPWVKEHPEFYITSPMKREGTTKPYRGATNWFAHGYCGFDCPWVDTLQLDYRNPALRQAMIAELLAVAKKCDGVRCDMAMLVLNEVFARTWKQLATDGTCSPELPEFWSEALGEVRRCHAEFLFLAEVYWDLEPRLQQLGFDYTYDKRFFDFLVAYNGKGLANHLYQLAPEYLEHSAHFLENHDEQRVASLLAIAEHRAAALLLFALPGLRFLHEGQLRGARIHANVHFARRSPEAEDQQVAGHYERLFTVLPKTAVGRGSWTLLRPRRAWEGNATETNFVLIQWWQTAEEFDLVVVNVSRDQSQCYAPLAIADLAQGAWRFADLLGNEVHERPGLDLATAGLFLDVPGHAAPLFHFTRVI